MKICGVKLTHDAAVAVVEDGKLLFFHEMGEDQAHLFGRETIHP